MTTLRPCSHSFSVSTLPMPLDEPHQPHVRRPCVPVYSWKHKLNRQVRNRPSLCLLRSVSKTHAKLPSRSPQLGAPVGRYGEIWGDMGRYGEL